MMRKVSARNNNTSITKHAKLHTSNVKANNDIFDTFKQANNTSGVLTLLTGIVSSFEETKVNNKLSKLVTSAKEFLIFMFSGAGNWFGKHKITTSPVFFATIVAFASFFGVLFGSFSFSQSAYAAALSLSVSDNITTTVLPSSTSGTTATSSTTATNISVSTDNVTGYTLSLKHSSSDTAPALTGTNGSIASIDSQTQFINQIPAGRWGYKPTKNVNGSWTDLIVKHGETSYNTGYYLPGPTTTEDVIDVTNAANATANEYNISIATKIDITTPPGTYSGGFVVAVISNEVHEVTFDMAYAIAGKSKVSGTNYYSMQDMTPEICSAVTLLKTTTLVDTRDNNKTYSVAKLDDTNCWMTQNLTLGSSSLGSKTLTSADSDVSSNFTLSTPTTTSFSTSNYNVVNYRNYTTNNSNYYNWYTATAGTGTKSTAAYTAATSSICPKGWRLPNGSSATNAAGEYAELLYAAGITSTLATLTTSVSYATGGKNKMTAAPYNIATTYGYFNTTGTAPTGTSYSSFWTNRTYSSANYAWSTYIGTSSANLNYGSRYKSQGLPIRCVAHRASIQPTITYNANGGTGSIASQTAPSASEFTQSLTLSDGTGMTRANHVLAGWSTNPNTTPATAEYKPGQTISTNSNLNLYAIWYDISSLTSFDSAFASAGKTKDTTTNLYKMQDMDSTICGNTTNTEITTYVVSAQLVDTRDGKIYWVSKLKDGNCWMTQNLDYDISSSTNTISNLDGTTSTWTSSSTYPPQQTTTSVFSSTTSTDTYSYDPGSKYLPNGTGSATSINCTSSSNGGENCHYHLGNYYQWNAATAGTGGTITSTNANSSICPAGWRLPTSNSYTNNYSFGKLTNAYGITNSANGFSDAALIASPLWFVHAGYVGSGSLYGQGTNGYVWSSRAFSSTSNAYNLSFHSTYVNPSNNLGRYNEYSVRCVAR